MTKTKRIILTLLSLIGLALAIELCVVYYNANFAIDAKPSICAINDMMDCDGVAKTSYSQFFGIPLSLWGVLLYLFFLFMTYADKIQNIKWLGFFKVFKNPSSYLFCIGLFSFLISLILGGISVFKIDSICIFCFMTYFINLLIAITAKSKGISIIEEFKTTIVDFIEAIKVKIYAFWFTLILLLMASVLTYTTVSNILAPQMAKRTLLKEYYKDYKYVANGNELGPKDANVIIHEYMDFNCQGCFLANLYLHRIVSEFQNVKVIQHNVPLDGACNHNVKDGGHKDSCLKASYALAAAKQNQYWQMADMLFSQAPDSEKEIIEAARLLDLDIKKLKEDVKSKEIAQEIKLSIEDADSKNVVGTPTLFIGIKQILGINTYPNLKQAVIEQGGIEKP